MNWQQPLRSGVILLLTVLPLQETWAVSTERSDGISLLTGLPHPINLSYDHRLGPKSSLAIAGGGLTIPYSNNQTRITASISNLDARYRWHCFEGAFFLGLISGIQTLRGKVSQTFNVNSTSILTNLDLNVRTLYITPHLGWIWLIGGFTIGLELGSQVPVTSGSTFDTSVSDPALNGLLDIVKTTQPYNQVKNDVENVGRTVGQISFPYFALRLGWSF